MVARSVKAGYSTFFSVLTCYLMVTSKNIVCLAPKQEIKLNEMLDTDNILKHNDQYEHAPK